MGNLLVNGFSAIRTSIDGGPDNNELTDYSDAIQEISTNTPIET